MSAGRTRVVFLSHAFMVGGAEEMVLNLVRHLPERFEPVVVCIHDAGPIGEETRQTGVPFTAVMREPVARPGSVPPVGVAPTTPLAALGSGHLGITL